MYETIKTILTKRRSYCYVLIGVVVLTCVCIGYIFYQPSGEDYQRTINNVERVEGQQRESTEYNQRIQRSIDRSTEFSHEAKERVDRSTQYNHEIENRIDESKASINKARSYLERNAELFDRIERANRERQENH